MDNYLQKKVDQSLRLLESAGKRGVVEVAYSGGKDSDVIIELTKMAGIEYRAIYKNTTIDPPGTKEHVLSNGVEIRNPKRGFYSIVRAKGFPSMFRRFCCSELKEYPILTSAVLGVRRAESAKRAQRYIEPEICRIYKGYKGCVSQILPITEWTNEDVEAFIKARGIQCHPLYYDADGKFHVERRLGCVGCPLKSDRGVADYLRYPKHLVALLRAGQHWLDERPNGKLTRKVGGDVFNLYYMTHHCHSYMEYLETTRPDMFGNKVDTHQFICDKYGITEDLTINNFQNGNSN